jgi:hypothetical protein
MAIITVQLGYVYQLQGKVTEALQLYYGILKSRAGDKAIAAVTSNNVIAAKGETELFDSMRRYKIASAPGLESKLTTSQRTVIALNGAILSLYRKKVIWRIMGMNTCDGGNGYPILKTKILSIVGCCQGYYQKGSAVCPH